VHDIANLRCEVRRCRSGAYHDIGSLPTGALPHRFVHLRDRSLLQAPFADVAHYTDDRCWLARRRCPVLIDRIDALADGVAVWEILAGEASANDDHRRLVCSIVLRERAAFQHRNAERGEIIRRDPATFEKRALVERVPFDLANGADGFITGKRRPISNTNRSNTGQFCNLTRDFTKEFLRLVGGIALIECNAGRQCGLGLEPLVTRFTFSRLRIRSPEAASKTMHSPISATIRD